MPPYIRLIIPPNVNVTALWQEGDSSLAANPKDGSSTSQSLLSSSAKNHEETTGLVMSTTHHDDDHDDEEEQEVPVPVVSKLLRQSSPQFSHEKPFFPSLNPPSAPVPLVLSPLGDVVPSPLGDVVPSPLGDVVPVTINRYLRDYQREGIRFIHDSYARSRGCILGDDMGLGKTVQVYKVLYWPMSRYFSQC